MNKSEVLGLIWSVLYKETDLDEQGLKTLSEKILDAIESKIELKYGDIKECLN